MRNAEALTHRIVRLMVAEEEFDPESMAYFRLMMELRERRRDRFLFGGGCYLLRARRVVGGAIARPAFHIGSSVRICDSAPRV